MHNKTQIYAMQTRSRAKLATLGATRQTATETLGGGPSGSTDGKTGPKDETDVEEETDVESLDMDVCDGSEDEAVNETEDEDDFEVQISRFQPRASSSPPIRQATAPNGVQPARTEYRSTSTKNGMRAPQAHKIKDVVNRAPIDENRARNDRDAVRNSNKCMRSAPVKWIKPEKFAATTPLESYVSHFETVAAYNQWSSHDKVAHLKAALTGDAAQLLWDSGNHANLTYDDLLAKLRARFGSAEHRERFACQLRSIRRQPGQSLQALCNEIRRLMALAYPNTANSELSGIIARDAFLAALNDRELEIKVRDRDPVDLDAALRAAVRVEAYLRMPEQDAERDRNARMHKERFDTPRARQVREPSQDASNEMATAIRELREQLQKSQQTQVELSRELGRVRLLAECRSADQNSVGNNTENRTRSENLASVPRRRFDRPRGASKACYACGDETHFARDCPTRRSETSAAAAVSVDHSAASGDAVGTAAGRLVRRLTDGQLDRAAYLRMCIQGQWTDCLLDTGSEVCLFPGRYARDVNGSLC